MMKMSIYKITLKLVMFTNLLLCTQGALGANGGFYNQENMYRGFYWFEEPDDKQNKPKDILSNDKDLLRNMTPEIAKLRIEERKRRLNDAKAMMLEHGFSAAEPEEVRKYIRKYKALESEMFDGAFRLGDASRTVAFTNPEIADRINNPVNAFGNKLRRQKEAEERKQKVAGFASKYDLILFEKAGCRYSLAFAPIFERFSGMHGFTYERTWLHEEKSRLLAQKYGIDEAPIIVAVSKDGSDAFELSRGLLSISEIEEAVEVAVDYLDEHLKAKNKQRY